MNPEKTDMPVETLQEVSKLQDRKWTEEAEMGRMTEDMDRQISRRAKSIAYFLTS